MIVVRVELHSAVTGRVTTIGLMRLVNDGTGTPWIGNYDVQIMRHGSAGRPRKANRVEGHRRRALPIWTLIRKALDALKY